jgi:hypothetical protein
MMYPLYPLYTDTYRILGRSRLHAAVIHMLLGLRADRAWEFSECFHGMSPVTSIVH